MNIFFLSRNSKKCAKYHANVHVIKMILETAQLLFSAHHIADSSLLPDCEKQGLKIYKKTHVNHPCAKWVRSSKANYYWLSELGMYLCYQYSDRYNKIHATEGIMTWLYHNVPDLSDEDFEEPPQVVPEEYKGENTVQAYRKYYMEVKAKNIKRFSYDNSEYPFWWED